MKQWISLFCLALSCSGFSQTFNASCRQWADSVFSAMDTNQRIGQLFIVEAKSRSAEKHFSKLDTLVSKYHIGGVVFLQRGSAMKQVLLTNRYQALAKTPLMVCLDAEWGLQMRLDSTMYFPRQMTLGAIQNNEYIYKMGRAIAKHCKRMGIHINFAPAVDININPDNPVIGVRSFGEDKIKVAEKGIAYMKGMQHEGIIANAKHFPGHGDTDTDSHFGLPVINHDKKRLDDIELYPFRRLIKDSLMSMMIAHINLPAYDSRPNMATTLSPAVVNGLLKKQLGFNGLIFTDALNMKGVVKYYQGGEISVMALLAGNDILLVPEDVPNSILKIKEALRNGTLKWENINASVKKILMYKYWANATKYTVIDTTRLIQDLNPAADGALRQEMYEKAMILLRNEKNMIPFKDLGTYNFASLSIGAALGNEMQTMLDNYAPFHHFSILKKDAPTAQYLKMIDSLSKYSRVIIGLHDPNNKKKENYGISDNSIELIKKLQTKTNVTVIHFGNAYAIRNIEFANTLICAFEDNEVTRKVVPQLLFGAAGFEGKLPVTVSPGYKYGAGLQSKPIGRLKYTYPEQVGIPSSNFSKIDSIIYEAIKDGSTPGAQMTIVKAGVVVYQKNFGYHTYDKTIPVTNQSVYDLASVTKTAATMQATMFLHGWDGFDPDRFTSDYLSEIKGTNKDPMILRDMMVHQAGLVPFLEHWRKSLKNNMPDDKFYSKKRDKKYPRQVAASLYASAALEDSMWRWTLQSKKLDEKSDTGCYSYKYSDLAFYFLKRIAEKQLNQPLDEFLKQNFYKPLGLRTMSFKPLENSTPIQAIPPTEEDRIFRNSIIRGTVHDQGAAMQGGVAGHAGIFSNANDLAILGQMNLLFGKYGGVEYLKEGTLKEFTRQQYYNNRRALGWDRPFPPDEKSAASISAYGHTGFTGTAWWIDPENQLVIVFLSNRTYPFADNKRLTTNSVRTKLVNAVYEVCGTSVPK